MKYFLLGFIIALSVFVLFLALKINHIERQIDQAHKAIEARTLACYNWK